MSLSSPTPLQLQIDRFIHAPLTEFVLVLPILASVILMVAEVALQQPGLSSVFNQLDGAIAVIFVVELSLRYFVARKKNRFFRQYWIDIIAVIPFLYTCLSYTALAAFAEAAAGWNTPQSQFRKDIFNASCQFERSIRYLFKWLHERFQLPGLANVLICLQRNETASAFEVN
ncbi:ion transporter [Pleurocapsales cyanobacterium LEGE 06147]|nr:ion transporter [Pleurocapsales cyanobacterium LEGE 06147]